MTATPGPPAAPSAVVALVDDLMFLSRIREAAARAGLSVRAVRTVQDAVAAAAGARLFIADLDSPRLPVAETLSALAAEPSLAGLARVGFFSHVEVERGRAAEAAGCRALPRGTFVQRLPEMLATATDAPARAPGGPAGR